MRGAALTVAAVGTLLPGFASANTFSSVVYKTPSQCERAKCLSEDSTNCMEHLPGFYLNKRGCSGGEKCTKCTYGGDRVTPTECECETKPYEILALYGDPCDASKICAPGEGTCFRKCDTYLHVSHCPNDDRCTWANDGVTGPGACIPTPAATPFIPWSPHVLKDAQAPLVDPAHTPTFPLSFADFQRSAHGYMLYSIDDGPGVLLSELEDLELRFVKLDANVNGVMDANEFAMIPAWLRSLEPKVIQFELNSLAQVRRLHLVEQHGWPEDADWTVDVSGEIVEESTGRKLSADDTIKRERRLQGDAGTATTTPMSDEDLIEQMKSGQEDVILAQSGMNMGNIPWDAKSAKSAKICGSLTLIYCGLTKNCMTDCEKCSWRSAIHKEVHTCKKPTPSLCAANGKKFCELHQASGSSKCVDKCEDCGLARNYDATANRCQTDWWNPVPSDNWNDWKCGFRNKVGMACRADEDCINGLRRCGGGICLGLPDMDPNHKCDSHDDCNLGSYCQRDPAGFYQTVWVNPNTYDPVTQTGEECIAPNVIVIVQGKTISPADAIEIDICNEWNFWDLQMATPDPTHNYAAQNAKCMQLWAEYGECDKDLRDGSVCYNAPMDGGNELTASDTPPMFSGPNGPQKCVLGEIFRGGGVGGYGDMFFQQLCRPQKTEPAKCTVLEDCNPRYICNTAEPTNRCRRKYSLAKGQKASNQDLCKSGWTDKTGRCAGVPAQSKNLARSCASDDDCSTTDFTGRNAECTCKDWWSRGDSKVCKPVTGDFNMSAFTERSWVAYRAENCGSFWNIEECLEQGGWEAKRYYYSYMCEKQILYGGPYVPSSSCGISSSEVEPDFCSLLDGEGGPILVAASLEMLTFGGASHQSLSVAILSVSILTTLFFF